MSRLRLPPNRARRLWLLASGLFLAAVLAVLLLWLPQHIRTIALAELSSLFGRAVTADTIHLRLFPLELDVRQLRVAGSRPADPPSLEVRRLLLVPSPSWLWERRIVLARVRIEQPTVRIEASGSGTGTVPALGPLANAGGLRIRRLTVEGGALLLDHRRVPLELDLPEVDARLNGRRGGALEGQLALGPGTARFGTAPPLPIRANFDVHWQSGIFKVDAGHLHTDHSDLSVAAELQVSTTPLGRIRTEGTLDLDELDRHVLQTGLALAGTARYAGEVMVDGAQLSLSGHFDGHSGAWKGAPIPRFSGDVAWGDSGIRIRGLSLDALGGAARLDLDVPPPGGQARVEGRLERVDAEQVAVRLFGLKPAGVGASATGDVRLTWPRGRFRDVSGRATLSLASIDDGRTPARGVFGWEAENGTQKLTNLTVTTRDLQIVLHGRIGRDRRADVAVEARSSDLAATDDLGFRVRRALGTTGATRFAVSGRGAFDGTWRGTLDSPVFEGRFAGTDVVYLGIPWGRTEWTGRASEQEIESHPLVVRRANAELSLDGRMEPGGPGGRDGLDVSLRFTRWPAEDLVHALEWDVSWSGLLSGEAEIHGRRRAPQGRVSLVGEAGRYHGFGYDALHLDGLLQGDRTQVTRGEAVLGGGSLTFEGSVTAAGVYDGSMEAKSVDVGALVPPLRAGIPWGGRVSGSVRMQGSPERPRLDARFTSPHLFLGDEGVGALDAEMHGDGDGQVTVAAHVRSPRTDGELNGHIDAAPPYAADFTAQVRNTSLDPFLRLSLPADAPGTPGIVASGGLTLRGPLQRPLEVSVEAALTDLQVLIPDYPVRNVGPMQMALSGGRLLLRDIHVAGEGTNLVARGSMSLLANGPLDVDVEGAADLRSLAAITRRLRARGDAVLNLGVRGTRDAPRLDGQLELKGAGVRVRDFPHGLEEVHGAVHFTEQAAQLHDVVGQLGGGEVAVDGQATYGRRGLLSVDLTLSGHDIALRYPEGLRSLSNVELRVLGDGVSQWVTGNIDVRQAVWTRRYDVASELLSAERPTGSELPLHEGVRFDVTIAAPGTLKVDNNLGALEASADLRLQGTSDNPVLLGRAEIEHGRIYFQGNTYTIRTGRIEFANPQRLDPFFEIEAETRLRSYRVNLKMSGTLERVYPTLHSDPPLSAVQILSLLAGSDEQDFVSATQAQTDQARLAAAGAASLAAGRLSEQMGLEREAERFFGLNRFSIDPSLLKSGVRNPAARLTVGKRITPDLNVLYSIDLHGSDERLLSVEYMLPQLASLTDKGASILLTRSDTNGLGFDVRIQYSR